MVNVIFHAEKSRWKLRGEKTAAKVRRKWQMVAYVVIHVMYHQKKIHDMGF